MIVLKKAATAVTRCDKTMQYNRHARRFSIASLPVCTEKSNPRVVMVKSAQDGVRTDETGSLNRPRIRRIFV